MFCRCCGKELPEEAQFCPHCGSPVAFKNAEGAQGQGASPGDPGGQYGSADNGYSGQGTPPYPPYPPRPYPNPQDVYSGGWIALGLFFPLVGLILYLVWQTEFPNRARACGKGALIGVIVSVSLVVLMFILMFIIIAIAASAGTYYAVAPALIFG